MECKVCYEIFDEVNFTPKIMTKCGHSFCKICMERISDGKSSIACPVCREKTRLIRRNDKIPVNFALLEVMAEREEREKDKNILEKYKYFDSSTVEGISEHLTRVSEPNLLKLKKIVNDDFIYVEHRDKQQQRSVFSSFSKRSKRYNFNKNSMFRFLADERSYSIALFRKASKCRHSYSCAEIVLRRCFSAFSLFYLLRLPVYYGLQYSEMFSPEECSTYSSYFFLGFAVLFSSARFLKCTVSFYLDQLLSIK